MARLSVSLLGAFQATLDGEPITAFGSAKTQALLAYVAIESDRPHRRETLAALLWPEEPDPVARSNFRHALSNLRKVIGDRDALSPALLVTRETVQFNTASDCWLDVEQFRRLLLAWHGHGHPWTEACPQCLAALAEAVELYRGDFPAGFSLRDSASFDEWQFFQTEGLRQELASALEGLVRGHIARGAYEAAIPYARRWLALDPLHEPVHRHLMQLYAQTDQRSAALRQYGECVRILEAELALQPSEETTSLCEHIRASPAVRSELLLPASLPGRDLPGQLTPHVDRLAHELPVPSPPGPSPAALQGERRLVTVVLAQVSGSTALLEEAGTEAWFEIIGRVFQILASEIYRLGGEIDQFREDGLVALFGMTASHEDDAERAVLAGLAMEEAIETALAEVAERVGAGGSCPIELLLRVGVNTGEVIVASTGGSRQRGEEMAVGRAIALAARTQGAAEPGMVLVSENTYRLVRPLFEWEPLGEVAVEAAGEGVAVYRPLAHRASSDKGRGIVGMMSPLVGRRAEFRALREAVSGLRAGVGGLVTIMGEAGIGKSRLMAEVRRQALREVGGPSPEHSAIQWVEGRCLSYASATGYHLWLDMLRGLLGLPPDTAPGTARDLLREWVRRQWPDRYDDVYPYLAWLMSLPLEADVEAALRGLGSKGLKVGAFRAVETLVGGAARERPLALVCEDLHWADPTSLELLEQLMALTDRVPLLFICVFRPETGHGCWRIKETAARRYRHRHTELWLEPLSPGESETLVGNMLSGKGPVLSPVVTGASAASERVAGEVRERILAHAEGNPFYVEETVRSLIDGGVIALDEPTGRWQVVRDVADIAIPDTLHGVLMGRIDGLQAGAKRVLQLASVIGRIFTYPVLAAVAQERGLDDAALHGHLLALQRAQMIRERARVPEVEYILKHHLTQQAAYKSMLGRERRAIHRRVAQVLEGSYPDRIEEQVELLAHHWARAEEPQKAVGYLVRAGQKAAERYANQEALGYYGQALERVEAGAERDRILAHRAGLLLSLYRGQEAAGDYGRLLESARGSGNRRLELDAVLGLAGAYYAIALNEAAFAPRSLELYKQAHGLASELGDGVSIVRSLLPTLHFTDFWSEYQDRANRNAKEALSFSQEIGDEDLLIDSMMAVAKVIGDTWVNSWYGSPVSAPELDSEMRAAGLIQTTLGDFGEDVLKRIEARRDLIRLREHYFRLANIHYCWGNLERCIECCDAGVRLAADLGMVPVLCHSTKAHALLDLGRYDAAWESLEEEIIDDEHRLGHGIKQCVTGLYLLELMAFERASATFETLIEQARPLQRHRLARWAQAQLARALIGTGRFDPVRLQEIADELAGIGARFPADLEGEIALFFGRLDQALERAEAAVSLAREMGARTLYVSGRELQSRVLLRLGRPEEVVALADGPLQMAQEMGYLPMVWRLRGAKGRALAALGRTQEATQEHEAVAALVRKLAQPIPDAELKRVFLSRALASLALAAPNARTREEVKRR